MIPASVADPRRRFAVEKLDVFGAALELLRLYDPLRHGLWRRNPALCRQLERALASLLSNIGEAASCLTRGDRRRYFEYAYRSAGECSAQLIAFRALGAMSDEGDEQARILLHRIQMMLLRLIQRSAPPPNPATPE